MNLRWMLGGMLVVVMAGAQADDIRTWVDADGTTHFGDRDVAPGHSDAVQLNEGSFLRLEPVKERPPVTLPQGTAEKPPQSANSSRPCTPLIREVVDPRSGMHSQRDTGRCQEDEPLPEDSYSGGYPDYVWGDVPVCAPGVVPRDGLPPCQHRPRPNPRPRPTPHPNPVPKDTTDRVLNPRYIGDGIRK